MNDLSWIIYTLIGFILIILALYFRVYDRYIKKTYVKGQGVLVPNNKNVHHPQIFWSLEGEKFWTHIDYIRNKNQITLYKLNANGAREAKVIDLDKTPLIIPAAHVIDVIDKKTPRTHYFQASNDLLVTKLYEKLNQVKLLNNLQENENIELLEKRSRQALLQSKIDRDIQRNENTGIFPIDNQFKGSRKIQVQYPEEQQGEDV